MDDSELPPTLASRQYSVSLRTAASRAVRFHENNKRCQEILTQKFENHQEKGTLKYSLGI